MRVMQIKYVLLIRTQPHTKKTHINHHYTLTNNQTQKCMPNQISLLVAGVGREILRHTASCDDQCAITRAPRLTFNLSANIRRPSARWPPQAIGGEYTPCLRTRPFALCHQHLRNDLIIDGGSPSEQHSHRSHRSRRIGGLGILI